MEIAELALRYLQTVVWPLTVVGLVWFLRGYLREAFGRMTRVETPVAAIEFAVEARQLRAEAEHLLDSQGARDGLPTGDWYLPPATPPPPQAQVPQPQQPQEPQQRPRPGPTVQVPVEPSPAESAPSSGGQQACSRGQDEAEQSPLPSDDWAAPEPAPPTPPSGTGGPPASSSIATSSSAGAWWRLRPAAGKRKPGSSGDAQPTEVPPGQGAFRRDPLRDGPFRDAWKVLDRPPSESSPVEAVISAWIALTHLLDDGLPGGPTQRPEDSPQLEHRLHDAGASRSTMNVFHRARRLRHEAVHLRPKVSPGAARDYIVSCAYVAGQLGLLELR